MSGYNKPKPWDDIIETKWVTNKQIGNFIGYHKSYLRKKVRHFLSTLGNTS